MSDQTLAGTQTAPPRPDVQVAARAEFLVRTYAHLLGAVLGFVALELLYFGTGLAESIARPLLSVNWLLVLGAFILVSFLARNLAARSLSPGAQYLGLAGYVVAESIIFVPLLYVADYYAPGAIRSAAALTVLGFVGLTAIVFRTGKDFSFLSSLIRWAGVVALIAIVGAVLFDVGLGTWFSVGMVGLAGAAILYDTSAILRTYPMDRHVSAALELFASVALMFWYLLSLFTSHD
jgi:FtsH-binding integral membrane protein